MFAEILRSELFQARSMVTFWKDCLKADCNDDRRIIGKRIKEAEMRDITNLVIVDGGELLGYVRVADVKNASLEKSLIHPVKEWILESSSFFPSIAERFLKDGVDKYNLYFVGDHYQNPIGIMTYADLNRKASYIYTYTLILFLEQWLKKKIVEKFQRPARRLDDHWMETLKELRKRNGESVKEWLVRTSKGTTPLARANLEHLVHVFRNDPAFEAESCRGSEVFAHTQNLRVKVAHPTKLLISKRTAVADLQHLEQFWKGMWPLLEANDFNEKNGGWPVESG